MNTTVQWPEQSSLTWTELSGLYRVHCQGSRNFLYVQLVRKSIDASPVIELYLDQIAQLVEAVGYSLRPHSDFSGLIQIQC